MIEKIALDTKYLSICKKLTRNYDDLWQDVLLKLCEKVHLLEKAENKESYVVACIYSTFLDECRKKSRSKLVLIADDYGVWQEYKNSLKQDNSRYLSMKATSELYKKIKSKEEGAELLWRTCNSNIHTVSKEEGKTFYKIKKEIEPIIKQLKRKLNE